MEIGGRACAGEGVVLCLPNLTLAKSPYRPQVGLCSGLVGHVMGILSDDFGGGNTQRSSALLMTFHQKSQNILFKNLK